MADKNTIKQQRDRFLAFSFASADLLLEIAEDGTIGSVLGATKSLTGIDDKDIIGKNWLALFSETDKAKLTEIKEKAQPGMRCGPVLVQFNEDLADRTAIFTAITMPDDKKFYITLGVGGPFIKQLAGMLEDGGIDAMTTGFKATDEPPPESMTTNFEPSDENAEDAITTDFDANDDNSPDPVTTDFDPSDVEEVETLTTGFDATKEDPEIIMTEITPEDIQGEKKQPETPPADQTKKAKDFKDIIDRVDFDIHFQPIVNLKTKEADHYEVLSRFKSGDTQEWIAFGEECGLSAPYDLAVVERTMNFIHYKAGMTRTRFSINISAKSIEDEDFFEKLQEQLALRDFKNRILFEITESTKIQNVENVANFIKKIQAEGYKTALDDFGHDPDNAEILKMLPANYVKIDEKYIRNALTSNDDEVAIRDIVKTCKAAKVKVIAEHIEEQEQADLLTEIGIELAQGFLFGKGEHKPNYAAPTV